MKSVMENGMAVLNAHHTALNDENVANTLANNKLADVFSLAKCDIRDDI